jgi:hypothetical protein
MRGDIVSDFYPQLINSETTASFFSQGQPDELNASCIMIYDRVAKQFVSHSGYVSVDLPPRRSVAHWDKYAAMYIGWGD